MRGFRKMNLAFEERASDSRPSFMHALALALLLVAPFVVAEELSFSKYEVYRGLVNADGHEDIYLKRKPDLVFLGIGLITPIAVQVDESYLLTGTSTGSFNSPVLDNSVDVSTLTAQTLGVSFGDYDNDGTSDIFVQGLALGDQSVLLTGTAQGVAPVVLDQFSEINGQDVSLASAIVTMSDVTGDGYADFSVSWITGGFTVFENAGTGQFEFDDPAVLAAETTTSTATLAGALPYVFRVDDRGQSLAAISLRVPAGVAGHQPQLSLLYNSGGGRKLIDDTKVASSLGYGWGISGIPEIRRCRRGVGGALELDATDHLCFGGNDLRLDSGTSYWADNAVYTVLHNVGVKVVAQGSISAGTRSFEVYLPDGRLQVYGIDGSQRVSPSNSSVVYSWKLASDTDDYGNVITYRWLARPSAGVAVPHFIHYDGAEIQFRYIEREDTTEVNLGLENVPGVFNQPFALDHIFTTIDSGSGPVNVALYRFDTELDTTSTYRRLEQVQHCGYDISGSSLSCTEPLQLTWITGTEPEVEFNNVVSRVDDGLGLWDEVDYELLPGFGAHVLELDGCDICQDNGSIYALGTTTLPSRGRMVVEEHRRSPIDGSLNPRRTTFLYDENARYEFGGGYGFVGFYATSRTQHDIPMYDILSLHTTHDLTTYRKHAISYLYQGRMPWVDQIVESTEHMGSPVRLSRTQRKLSTLYTLGNDIPHVAEEWHTRYEFGLVSSTRFVERELCLTSLSSGGACQSGTNGHVVQEKVTTRFGSSSTGTFTDITGHWGAYTGTKTLQGEVRSEAVSTNLNNDTTNWVIGFVDQIERVSDTPTLSPVTAVQTFAKDGNKSSIHSTTSFPNDLDLELTSTLTRNGRGQITANTVSGVDVASRSVSQSDFEWNRFPQTMTDPYLRDTDSTFDLRFGLSTTLTNPDGLTASLDYDDLGRLTSATTGTGDITSISRTNCSNTSLCNPITWGEPAYLVETTVANGVTVQPTRRTYFGPEGEVLLDEVEAFDNADGWRRIERHYDLWGRLKQSSLPYYSVGGTPAYVVYSYGEQGRLVREDRPDGSWTQTSYSQSGADHVVFVSDVVVTSGVSPNEWQTKRSVFNSAGQLTTTQDAYGTSDEVETTYTYTAHGFLDTVRVNNVQVADMNYDAAGNRKSIVEPNSGTTSFEFTALGELKESTDAKGQTTEFLYDLLGRLVERGEDCTSSCASTRSWTYDPVNGYGRIGSAAAPGITHTYVYRSDGLLDSVSSALSLSGFPDNGTRTISYGYANGRLTNTTYPGNLAFDYEYDGGYLARVKSGSLVVDEVDSLSAFGQPTRRTLGNGLIIQHGVDSDTGAITSIQTGTGSLPASVQDLEYEWRSNSHLHRRIDRRPTLDLQETFDYDALNRLDSSLESASNRLLDFDYDLFGNLETKTSNQSGDLDVTSYQYTNPHRLTSATIGGVSTTFGYDANGNITSYNAAGTANDKSIGFDAGNRATAVTLGSTSSPAAEEEFWYGPDGDRFLRKASWLDGSTTKVSWTVYLLNGSYEEVIPIHDVATDRYRKLQVTSSVLHRVREPNSGGAVASTEYVLRDNVGSVDVVTSSAQTVLHRTSFDAFGARRESSWDADLSAAGFSAILGDVELNTSRGFTDHELLDRAELVHMNGRIYDPRLGRFLQADPLVQTPSFSQSYNRYAYVLNSPLSFVDPSGFCAEVLEQDQYEPQVRRTPCYDTSLPNFVGQVLWFTDYEYAGRRFQDLIKDYLPPQSEFEDFQNQLRGTLGESGTGFGFLMYHSDIAFEYFDVTGPFYDSAAAISDGEVLVAIGAVGDIALRRVGIFKGSRGGGSKRFGNNQRGTIGDLNDLKLDRTGKVHGEIPDYVPNNATREQLEELRDDLRTSIRTRNQEAIRLGEDGPHRNRIREEQQLLRQIEKVLSGS